MGHTGGENYIFFAMICCVIDHCIRTDNTKSISLSLNAAPQYRRNALFSAKAPNTLVGVGMQDTQQVDD